MSLRMQEYATGPIFAPPSFTPRSERRKGRGHSLQANLLASDCHFVPSIHSPVELVNFLPSRRPICSFDVLGALH